MAKSIYYITISNALEGRVKIKTEKWQQNSPKQSREHAGGPKYIKARQNLHFSRHSAPQCPTKW